MVFSAKRVAVSVRKKKVAPCKCARCSRVSKATMACGWCTKASCGKCTFGTCGGCTCTGCTNKTGGGSGCSLPSKMCNPSNRCPTAVKEAVVAQIQNLAEAR